MPDFRVPILIEEQYGLPRAREPIRLGVPLPRGLLRDVSRAQIVDALDEPLPWQGRVLALWPDQSVKWLLVDALAAVGRHERSRIFLASASERQERRTPEAPLLEVQERPEAHVVTTGAADFVVGGGCGALLSAARIHGVEALGAQGVCLRLLGCSGREYEAAPERILVEEAGGVRSSIVLEGHFQAAGRRSALTFKARLAFVAGHSTVRIEIEVRNPQAASHPGGLWDLEDRGTVLFEDMSLCVFPAGAVHQLQWYAEEQASTRTVEPAHWWLYQDSSGGENWDSDNHIDGKGRSTVTFRGYRVQCGSLGRPMLIAEGDRATPCVVAVADSGSIAATALAFWQNFPKALRWGDGALTVGLFPRESRAPFALQGGEQKRHTVALEFLEPQARTSIPALQRPLAVCIDPSWVEHSRAVPSLVAARRDQNEQYLRYVGAILQGPHSFEAKREIVDEFGWRNFGDLYADHEAVGHSGPRPLVSHYNNQYDFVHGALLHFLRTGDHRWWQLAAAAASHTIDIDIYHTDRDKAAYNHGLFWHTDHYKPAATCTHRTYSRQNGRGRRYGGGPSNEHNYTSGLLLYYYLTGDPEAKGAVVGLAEWVIAMDDGTRSAVGSTDASPTGLASKTVDAFYHKPGRGAGNSINALLDGYVATGERRFLNAAEGLIRRCIHPQDDIEVLHLSEPEHRWSYLVFLQVLGKYLHLKLEWGELDYSFHYARASLLHYARWMLQHEVPYKEVLHKVELPTETWPAQDIRKCHVLHLAAGFSPPGERDALHGRAAYFFERSLADTLSFPTAFVTRPLVILCVYGHVHAYFQAHRDDAVDVGACPHSFGGPEVFTPQRMRGRFALLLKLRLLLAHLVRAGAERLDVLGRYTTPSRM